MNAALLATCSVDLVTGERTRLINRRSRMGSVWRDQNLVHWTVLAAVPVKNEPGTRLGWAETSRHATVDEVRHHVMSNPG